MSRKHLDPTQKSGAALFSRRIEGEVVMLNLLRFREVADYSQHPELAPDHPISGREAYQKYIDHTQPMLEATGGGIMFLGEGGSFLIGPEEEQWDVAMLVRQKSLSDFMSFATDKKYLAGIGHRTAALEDSRLLPLVELRNNRVIHTSTNHPRR